MSLSPAPPLSPAVSSSDTPASTRIAAIQTVSGPDVEQNLQTVARLVAEAAAAGARLVALPEYFSLITADEQAKVRVREADGSGPQQDFLAELAQRHEVWLVGGTIPLMGLLSQGFPKAQMMVCGVLGPKSNAHGPNEFLHVPYAKKLTAAVAQVIASLP